MNNSKPYIKGLLNTLALKLDSGAEGMVGGHKLCKFAQVLASHA